MAPAAKDWAAAAAKDWAEMVRLELIEDVGRAAYYRDVTQSANPYELESERHAWEVGWLLAAFLGTGGAL